jgi:hypothetical protein
MVTPVRRVFPEYADKEHEKDFSFCLEGVRELFKEKKDNSRAAQGEREERTVGEGFEKERTEVVLQEED